MNYVDQARQDKRRTKALMEALPNEMNGFKQMRMPSLEDTVLTAKTKELIAMAMGVGIRCESCIVAHMGRLIALDVTREEVLEALGVCLYMGGGPATAYAGKALDCFEQLQAEKEARIKKKQEQANR